STALSGGCRLQNSIVAGNRGPGYYGGPDCGWPVVSLGNNIDSDGSCGLNAAGDLSNIDPLLAPLRNNGGPTHTHALLPGSPALDRYPCSATTDQRSVQRPYTPSGLCDVGAYEWSPIGDVQLTIKDVKET